jgi:hypothetical protein
MREGTMNRLRVREVAQARMNLSQLHAAVNARLLAAGAKPVAMGTLRRYWYSTRDGKERGDPIELVDIHLLGTIARVLGVKPSELMNEDALGQPAAVAA